MTNIENIIRRKIVRISKREKVRKVVIDNKPNNITEIKFLFLAKTKNKGKIKEIPRTEE